MDFKWFCIRAVVKKPTIETNYRRVSNFKSRPYILSLLKSKNKLDSLPPEKKKSRTGRLKILMFLQNLLCIGIFTFLVYIPMNSCKEFLSLL